MTLTIPLQYTPTEDLRLSPDMYVTPFLWASVDGASSPRENLLYNSEKII